MYVHSSRFPIRNSMPALQHKAIYVQEVPSAFRTQRVQLIMECGYINETFFSNSFSSNSRQI